MRSQLTRTIFKRLLSNEPLLFCRRRSSCSKLLIINRPLQSQSCHLRPRTRHRHDIADQKRTLWGFSIKPPRVPKQPVVDPGLATMMELLMVEKQGHRPPPIEDLVVAWRTFFEYKDGRKEPLLGYQAEHALRCFRHLMKQKNNSAEGQDGAETRNLTSEDLSCASKALTRLPNDQRDAHNKLARELYAGHVPTKPWYNRLSLKKYISVLVETGDTAEAKSTFQQNFVIKGGDEESKKTIYNAQKMERQCLTMIMKGFSREGNEEGLLETIQLADARGVRYTPEMQLIVVKFFANRNNIEQTKHWFHKQIEKLEPHHPDTPDPETISTVLQFSIRNKELDWCRSVFRTLLVGNPTKDLWDIIFQWAAGALGKGVEDVERMMKVMIRVNEENGTNVRPDIKTFNGLVRLAMSSNDPYLAERYLTLGLKYGILPDAETLILQLGYRIDAGDITGAHVVYRKLQSEEVHENADLPSINKYIRALCTTKQPNYTLITSICSDLDERKARLEAPTVSALGLMYLDRGEIENLIDMLQVQSYHYSSSERAAIRDTYLAYCLDPTTSTARAWDSYNVFRQIFAETDITVRTQVMNEFFRRGRSDMALHTFGHMRSNDRYERRPILSTYVQCLEGIARCADLEALETVHNMLKMDATIEPNTQLFNALMLAYTACDDSDKAVGFWDDITNSREGPSYRSLEIIFRACQRKPFGDRKAREIWDKMRRMEIEVTKNVFVAYMGALAGQGKLDDAKSLIQASVQDLGFKPDVQILGTFYNAIPGQNRKDLVEEWAKDLWPEAWSELLKLGQFEAKEGHRLFKMPMPEFKA